jgi:hypothetical protein
MKFRFHFVNNIVASAMYQTAASLLAWRPGFAPDSDCGGESSVRTGFSQSLSVSSCQYHSTAAQYSLIHDLGIIIRPVRGRSYTDIVSVYCNI